MAQAAAKLAWGLGFRFRIGQEPGILKLISHSYLMTRYYVLVMLSTMMLNLSVTKTYHAHFLDFVMSFC